MEGLLILIGLWVLDLVIKKVAANRKEEQQRQLEQQRQQSMPQYQPDDEDLDDSEMPDEDEQGAQPPRSLQDLIRQFENAQREAAQGNIEPPVPPVPQPRLRDPHQPVTFRDVADAVIEMDVVDVEVLMDELNMSEGDAISALNELQKHRIVGRDMGDGECDVLVHDLDELNNLLLREKRVTPQQNALEPAEPQESMADAEALQQAQEQDAIAIELERQRKLNSLEGRAKSARESAAAFTGIEIADDADDGTAPKSRRAPLVSTRSIADVRRGFIWAKVLDEPRFKRRWSAQYR